MVDINNPSIPLLGQKPKVRFQDRAVANLVLNDAEGSAEMDPSDDLTTIEAYKLSLLMAWALSQPPGPLPDPETGGRTLLVVRTLWRQYIKEQGLERHFKFRLAVDLNAAKPNGNA